MSVILFISLIILCFLQILFRFIFNFSLSWTEELARYVFIALVYVAASLAVIKHAHVRVEIIDGIIGKNTKYYLDQIVDVLFCAFMIYIGIHAVHIVVETLEVEQITPALEWSVGWVYSIIPFTYFLISLRLMQNIYKRRIENKQLVLFKEFE